MNANNVPPKNDLMHETRYNLSPNEEIPAIKKDIEKFGKYEKKKSIEDVDPAILEALINMEASIIEDTSPNSINNLE